MRLAGGSHGQTAAKKNQVKKAVERSGVLEDYQAVVVDDVSAADQLHRVLGAVLDVGGSSQNRCSRAIQQIEIVVIVRAA